MEGTYTKTFASELYRVRPVLMEAIRYIRKKLPVMTRDDETDLRLIISELLYNAVIHGNRQDETKSVFLEVLVSGNTVQCRIRDQGDGFDHAVVLGSVPGDDMLFREHGRGIRLASSLADAMGYPGCGNEVWIVKQVSAGSY